MTDITCEFRFHPVGQGLFYSGRINDFRFVYDCGTDSGTQYMDAALSTYDASSKLDLLILSHFHEDHINGVRKLLTKTKGVKEVILPYLHPAERLLIAAGVAIDKNLEALPPSYTTFLADPAKFFAPKAERITFVPGGEAWADWEGYEPGERGEGEAGRWFPDNPLDKDGFPGLEGTADNVSVMAHRAYYGNRLWRFKFYCAPGRVSVADILRELSVLKIDTNNVAKAIRRQLKGLKEVYHILFGGSAGQNVTSLICCHGPVSPMDFCETWVARDLWPRPYGGCRLPKVVQRCQLFWRSGLLFRGALSAFPRRAKFSCPGEQMLTGDANIRVHEYERHFRHDLPNVGLFCLPHHGSRANWRRAFLTEHKNCVLWVCSAGLGNSHGHPHREVIDDLFAAKKFVSTCNEIQGACIAARGMIL